MEEKTRMIQRRTQSSSSSHGNDTIPMDLIIDILSRLPAKSIVRLGCVSKLWSAITTTPQFISSFAIRSSALRPSVLLIVKTDAMIFVFTSPLHKNNNSPHGPFPCVGSYKLKIPDYGYNHSLNYVHGLICFEDSKQLVICNPTLQRFFTLPKQKSYRASGGRDFLGYDPIDGKYKALRILTQFKIYILTLGVQGSSRIITKGFPGHHDLVRGSNWLCTNGVIYYEATLIGVGNHFQNRIMSFDVRTEKFNPIKYPEYIYFHSEIMIVHYEGRLAILKVNNFTFSFDIWILMDRNGDEWTHKSVSFVLPAGINPLGEEALQFNGVSDAGEFVFAPWCFSDESFYILYFDPMRNSIRQVLFEGNVGDVHRRRYGHGSNHIINGYMKCFPQSHRDSFVFVKKHL